MKPAPSVTLADNSLISAQNITVMRDGKRILHDVSLSVGAHDFITIVGPNGAGKTMLLRIMAGLMRPDLGQVIRKPALKIGYMPQKIEPDPTLPITVKRFISLRKSADANALSSLVERLQIEALMGKLLFELSGGELQRVMLARAMMGSPDLLVLDEPAQNLDVASQLVFYKTLDDIYATGNLSILMVSHDLHLVMASSKQVVCLFHHICCQGAPHMVANDPEFIQLFGNDTARMMAVYHHEHHHQHTH